MKFPISAEKIYFGRGHNSLIHNSDCCDGLVGSVGDYSYITVIAVMV